MNKRLLAALLCVVLALSVFALVACVKDPDNPDKPNPDNPPQPTKTVYDTLNELAAKPHDNGKLTVVTTVGDDVLTSTYTLTTNADGVKVEYAIQTLATLSLEETTTERIVTTNGSYVVKDGKVVQQNGQNCDIALEKVTAEGIKFDKTYFAEAKETDGKFVANVTNVKGFIGDVAATDMAIEVTYTAQAITNLVINYTTTNATVTMTYAFA